MSVETDTPVISIERTHADRVIRLDVERAQVIAVEEGDVPGIPVFVRACETCNTPDLSEWYFAPDRDLGTGWACRECGQDDSYRWNETSLSMVRGYASPNAVASPRLLTNQ